MKNRPFDRRRPASGLVLMVALVCLTVITLALTAMFSRAAQGRRQLAQRQRQIQAQWLLESALDRAAAQVATEPGVRRRKLAAVRGRSRRSLVRRDIHQSRDFRNGTVWCDPRVGPIPAGGRVFRSAREAGAYLDPLCRRSDMKRKRKPTSAFTLVELLVVIAIIAILVLLLLPAINALRESARRTQCLNQMSQLISAVHAYEMSHGAYPAGVTDSTGPILNQEQGLHQGWLIALLPFLEESNVYAAIDQQVSVYDKKNQRPRETQIGLLSCPSSPFGGWNRSLGVSNYAGVHHDVEAPIDSDNQGVLFLNSRLSPDEVTDGARYTLFLGEKIIEQNDDLGWMSGTRATLRNTGTPIGWTGRSPTPAQKIGTDAIDGAIDNENDNEDPGAVPRTEQGGGGDNTNPEPSGDLSAAAPASAEEAEDPAAAADRIQELRRQGLYVGGFGSHHLGGAIFAFGDGHVTFLAESVDWTVYQRLGNRADGEILDARALDRD